MAADDFDALDDPTTMSQEELERTPKGLPNKWAEIAEGPLWGDLPRGWRQLLYRYSGLGPSDALDTVLRETVAKQDPGRVMLESDYVDEDYRDEFSHFYAQTHRPLPNRCERLHFFGRGDGSDEQRYLGFVVVRPIVGRPICRTMIAPPTHLAEHISCVADASATPYGFPLRVRSFPFISQDSQYGTCSHAAIWMVALYFHLRFRRPRYHLSDLAGSARQHQEFLPAIPSGGLTARQINAVLHDLEMPPLIYRLDRLPPGESVASIACRYLNSRLPVILLDDGESGGHARVFIGYGRDQDGEPFFVHHDDQRGPYLAIQDPAGAVQADKDVAAAGEDGEEERGGPGVYRSERRWQALIVPLPGRIYLSGESAERTARLIFEDLIDDHNHLDALRAGLDDARLRLRTYVTQVGEYKTGLRQRLLPDDVVAWHVNISTSRWVWVVELQDREAANAGPDCVLGEVVIDATSDDQWPNPLFGNLPGLRFRWPRIGDDIELSESSQGDDLYRTGSALHVGA